MKGDCPAPNLDHRPPVARRRVLSGLGASALAAAVLLGSDRAGRAAPAAVRPTLPASPPPPIRFEVLRGSEVIGSHVVDFQGGGSDFSVRTRIDITVRVLGVTAFAFKHDSTERWRDGMLQAFDSKTNDDGGEFFVIGRATADGFKITHRKGEETGPADIMVGSYWTPLIARQAQLIDPQRGRVKEQQLLSTDMLAVPVANNTVEATRYRVVGVTDGWVAYDATGRWLAAELRKKGSDILYRLPR
jgi:hypothetical protein